MSAPGQLSFPQLSAAQQSEVEGLLGSFAALSDPEKDSARASTTEKVFTAVFGESAVVEGSAAYEAHHTQPWCVVDRSSRLSTLTNRNPRTGPPTAGSLQE